MSKALPSRVLLMERNNEGTIRTSHALCLAISMAEPMRGEHGEPGLELITVSENEAAAGTADWHQSLRRLGDVVHASHQDWKDGRVSVAYDMADTDPVQTIDLNLLAARAAHEGNRILCGITGDRTHLKWEDSPQSIQYSSRFGAKLIEQRPNETPEQQHESWLKYKLAEGWKHGDVRDAEAKTHPALLPYAELSIQQQVKDWLFGAVVRAVLGFPQLDTAGMPTLPLLQEGFTGVAINQLESLATAVRQYGANPEYGNMTTLECATDLIQSLVAQRDGLMAGQNSGGVTGNNTGAITNAPIAGTPKASDGDDDEEEDDDGTEVRSQAQSASDMGAFDQADTGGSPGHPVNEDNTSGAKQEEKELVAA